MTKYVLVLDSYRLYADALAQLIDRIPGLRVTATATNGSESLWSYDADPPDIAVIGLQSPGTYELESIRAFRQKNPQVKIVLLVDTPVALQNVFQTDAVGYVLKTDSREELCCALRYAADGVPYFSEKIAAELTRMGALHRPAPVREPENDPALLTRREWEIIALVARE